MTPLRGLLAACYHFSRIVLDGCNRGNQDSHACRLGDELRLLCDLREEIVDED